MITSTVEYMALETGYTGALLYQISVGDLAICALLTCMLFLEVRRWLSTR